MQSHLVKNMIHINEDLSLAQMYKMKTVLDKPIYAGVSILDISKVAMYSYLYEHIYEEFDYRDVKCAYFDTDSAIMSINLKHSNEFYDMVVKNYKIYDLADYPKDHYVYKKMLEKFGDKTDKVIDENKKRVGTMKSETPNSEIKSLVAIRSKVYTYQLDN